MSVAMILSVPLLIGAYGFLSPNGQEELRASFLSVMRGMLWTAWLPVIFASYFLQKRRFLFSACGLWIVVSFGACMVGTVKADVTGHMIARLKGDMRSMASVLESYRVDHGAYPPWTLDSSKQVEFSSDGFLPSFRHDIGNLTTPISYMTYYMDSRATAGAITPLEHYLKIAAGQIPEKSTFAYWAPDGGGFILLAKGVDKTFDLDFEALQAAFDPMADDPWAGLTPYKYDPSNGTISPGDIWYASKN